MHWLVVCCRLRDHRDSGNWAEFEVGCAVGDECEGAEFGGEVGCAVGDECEGAEFGGEVGCAVGDECEGAEFGEW